VSHYYILVKAMHRERFQATSKLKIWTRLISAETKRVIITRSFPAVWLEGPPKCDQVFPTRADQGSQSARFAIQLVHAGRVGIILALCASKMPVGNTSRPSKHPWTNRGTATECVIDLIPSLKFDQSSDLRGVSV